MLNLFLISNSLTCLLSLCRNMAEVSLIKLPNQWIVLGTCEHVPLLISYSLLSSLSEILSLWYISEQNICSRICSAKSDWLHSVKHPTVSDFIAQRKDIEDTLQPILSKLSAQCEYFYCPTVRFQNSFWNTKKNHMKRTCLWLQMY